jgi:hypothetical protein
MSETKPKQSDAMRTPKPKKKLGLVVPPALRMPHEDLISASSEPPDQVVAISPATLTSQTSLTTRTSLTSPTTEEIPLAPQRDYTKVANSIGRKAVPAGLFTGKSKQLYDCLYTMTRGAIVPTRTIRISRPKLMRKAHIGSRVTFDANIERLVKVGLVIVQTIAGEHEGNEYTVYLPEEVDLSMTSQTSHTTMTSLTRYAQKLVRLVCLETSQTRHTSSPLLSTTSRMPKTSFKTSTEKLDDDEAFARFARVMQDAAKEIMGKPLGALDKDRLGELAELLVAELRIAAARTSNVSSLPAFLTEHLRRRLWKMDKKQVSGEEKSDAGITKPTISPEQARNCPDCGGSGLYYPEGYERGVAKCRHERLKLDEGSTPST